MVEIRGWIISAEGDCVLSLEWSANLETRPFQIDLEGDWRTGPSQDPWD